MVFVLALAIICLVAYLATTRRDVQGAATHGAHGPGVRPAGTHVPAMDGPSRTSRSTPAGYERRYPGSWEAGYERPDPRAPAGGYAPPRPGAPPGTTPARAPAPPAAIRAGTARRPTIPARAPMLPAARADDRTVDDRRPRPDDDPSRDYRRPR